MSEPITVTGMVLSSMPMGEYDRRLVLLTRERGKITAFARGARKSTSPLLAASNTFAFGSFRLYEGRSSYSLNQASIQQYFTELAKAQPEVYYGYYFLEFADYYGREGTDESQMLNLLYVTLKALLNDRLNNELIKSVFELKAMVINGEYPQVFECQNCGSKEDLINFSVAKSGMFCAKCRSHSHDPIPVNSSVLYTFQYVIAAPLDKLYNFAVTDEVLTEVRFIMNRYVDGYTDKKFKTLEILKMMC